MNDKSEREVLDCYRRVRGEIRQFVHRLTQEYEQPPVYSGAKS